MNGGAGRGRRRGPGRRRHPGAGRRAVDRGHGDARGRGPGGRGHAGPGRQARQLARAAGRPARRRSRRSPSGGRPAGWIARSGSAPADAAASAPRSSRAPRSSPSTSPWCSESDEALRSGHGRSRARRHRDRVCTVTLNRPEARNALSVALQREAGAALAAADADADVDVVILTGTDPGVLRRPRPARAREGRVATSSAAPTTPSISRRSPRSGRWRSRSSARSTGRASRAASSSRSACDFLIASERAAFADTHARVGVMPAGGMSVFLPQVVGVRKAKEMSLSGNFMGAHEAFARGLVNHVVAHEELLAGSAEARRRHRRQRPGRGAEPQEALRREREGDGRRRDRPGAGVLPGLAHRSGRDRAATRRASSSGDATSSEPASRALREPHERLRRAHVEHREGPAAAVDDRDGAPARPGAGLGPPRRQDRAGHVADPADAPARRDTAAAHGPAAVVRRRRTSTCATTCAACEACEPTVDAVLDLARTVGDGRLRPRPSAVGVHASSRGSRTGSRR